MIIPNGDVYMSSIVNYSRAVRRRINLTLGVGYDSDLDKVTRVAHKVVDDLSCVLKEPSPSVAFQKSGESSIDFILRFWIDTEVENILTAQDSAVKALKEAFDREGIDIPDPTRTVIAAERWERNRGTCRNVKGNT